MYPSTVLAYSQFGTFLMVVMFVSLVYSTFFFIPLCTVIGPTNDTGQIPTSCREEKEEMKFHQAEESGKQQQATSLNL